MFFAYFKVQPGRCRAAALPRLGDNGPLPYALAHFDKDLGIVRVDGGIFTAVIDDDGLASEAEKPYEDMLGLEDREECLVYCANAERREKPTFAMGKPFGSNNAGFSPIIALIFAILADIAGFKSMIAISLQYIELG